MDLPTEVHDGPPRKRQKCARSKNATGTPPPASQSTGKLESTCQPVAFSGSIGDTGGEDEGLMLFTPPSLEEEEIGPLTREEFQEIARLEQQKLLGLARFAATYVFERFRYISKEQIRHIERLRSAANVTRPVVAYDISPFPRQIGDRREFFCGREKDLKELESYFTTTITEGKPRVQIISGYGGLGKTQLAFEYAHRYRINYPGGVLFFDLQTRSTFHDSVKDNLIILERETLDKLSQNFEKLQGVLRRLQKFLFIYDGADKLAEFIEFLPSVEVDVIVTTRTAVFDARHQGHNTLSLRTLDVPTSVRILISGCLDLSRGDTSIETYQQKFPEDFSYAEKISGKDCLDGLPLALLHADSFRRSQGPTFTFRDFWVKLQEGKGRLPLDLTNLKAWLKNYDLKRVTSELDKLQLEDLDDLRNLSPERLNSSNLSNAEKQELLKAQQELVTPSAYITWRLDIDSSCAAAKSAKDVLCVAATLPSNDIPERLLHSSISLLDKEYERTDVGFAIKEILSHSLLMVTASAGEQGRTFTMHTMIQYSVTKHLMQGEVLNKILTCIAQALCNKLPSASDCRKELHLADDSVKLYSSHLFHVAAVIANSKIPLSNQWQQEALAVACILSIRLQAAQVGLPLCERQLDEAKQTQQRDKLAYAMIELGRCYSMLLKKEAAAKLFEDALGILGDYPWSREIAEWWGEGLFEIIRGFRHFRLMERIEAIAKQMKAGLEWANTTDCQSYAQCLNALAAVSHLCKCARHSKEVDEVSFKALEVYNKSVSRQHPNFATELSNISHRRLEQGRDLDAEKFAIESLQIYRKVLPSQSHDTAYSLWLLGRVYLNSGQNKEAGNRLAEALDIVNSSCVTDLTFYTLLTFAEWQAVVGQKEESEKNLQKALEIMEQVIGNHDRDGRANALCRVGRCWAALGRYDESEESARKALGLLPDVSEDQYNLMNAYTLLGRCLVVQRKNVEAQYVLEKLLEVQQGLKLRDNTDRGTTLHYLGVCLLDQNAYERAEGLLRESLDIRVHCLVENDIRTASTYYELGRCLLLLGKRQEAKPLMRQGLEMARRRVEGNSSLRHGNVDQI